jgi:iron complex outermembrane receptor protein
MSNVRLLRHASVFALIIGGFYSISAGRAQAQSQVDSLTVTAARDSATIVAPSQAPLEAVQPTSVLSQRFIQNDIGATSNYDDIVKISPSVNSVGPNGPGLMENQSLTIRGFQDGQYNLTIDGIAWGDSNDFTHHTTSYVMGHDLGQVDVDRGPGTASTLGDATFGGTIAMNTKDPSLHSAAEAYGSVGSFNTYLAGGEFDTGSMAALGGARGLFDIEHLTSDGALTNMGQERTNLFAKMVMPVSDNTTITAAAMYNQLHQYVGLGATEAQYATLGYNYGLNRDPTSQAYFGYNQDKITTDLAYVDVKSDLGGGLIVDNKIYSYAYYHFADNGYDPNGETPNGTYYGLNHVPGQVLNNDYVSYGDMARLSKDFGFVVARTGFWYDHQVNSRALFDVDFTKGGMTDIAQPNGGYPPALGALSPNAIPGVERQQQNTLDTFQPYVEFDFKPLPGLTITPGVKDADFSRTIASPVNQSTYQPLYFSKTYNAVLPSVAAHYDVSSTLTTYAQVAQGFLAPNLNTFYTPNPSASTNLQPQTTWNYQAGAAYHVDRLTASGDIYYIDFGNKIGSRTVGNNVIFYNQGGVIYKGIEIEGNYRLIDGFSLYGNGSVNSAKSTTTHLTIANSPDSTAAAGLSYDSGPMHGSILAKYVGVRYGDDPELYKLPGYTTAQLSLGYTFKPSGDRPAIRISGLIDNLFDHKGVDALAGYTGGAGTPLFWNTVSRNYALKVSAAF